MKNLQTFEDFLNEAMNINDPVLMAMRATKMYHEKSLAAKKERMKKRVYGKQREKLEDELWEISQELKDLYFNKRQVFANMDAEAGQKGDNWTDDDANEYGKELNDIDSQIEKHLARRQEIEIKLAY